MPRLAEFYGIVIAMYYRDHSPPVLKPRAGVLLPFGHGVPLHRRGREHLDGEQRRCGQAGCPSLTAGDHDYVGLPDLQRVLPQHPGDGIAMQPEGAASMSNYKSATMHIWCWPVGDGLMTGWPATTSTGRFSSSGNAAR